MVGLKGKMENRLKHTWKLFLVINSNQTRILKNKGLQPGYL